MNSRLRTILFLISITAIFGLILILNSVSSAEAVGETDQGDVAPQSSEIDPITTSPQATDAIVVNITTIGSGNVTQEVLPQPAPPDHVRLTAVPDGNGEWEFDGWSGDLPLGANPDVSPLVITTDGTYNITATFIKRCFPLEPPTHGGNGADPVPTPIKSNGCVDNLTYYAGDVINLLADPDAHWKITSNSWSGTDNDSSMSVNNTVTMQVDGLAVSIIYYPICYPLTVNWNPEGGNVQYTGANCPGSTSGNQYLEGTVVGLEAFDAPGYVFSGWGGALTGIANPTTVTMNGIRTVTANFSLSCHSLTTTHSPPGTGSNPGALPTKSASCNTGEYVFGEEIALSSQPNAGWRVQAWTDTNNDNSTSNNNSLTFPALASGEGHVVGVIYQQLPTLQFKLASYQVNEDGGTATIEVERIGSSSESVDVWYATSDGTAEAGMDYVSTSNRLTFGSEIKSQSFEVTILDDNTKEGTETVNLTLSNVSSNAVLGVPDTAELVILDDEGDLTVQFQTTTYQAQEISPTLPISVTLFPIATENVYVEFRSTAGTATNGEDYVDVFKLLRFMPGETVKRVDISLIDDALDEPNETVHFELSNNDGADLGESQAIMTIIDDDDPPSLHFSSSEYFVKEGELTTPVTVTMSATSSYSITVDFDVIEVSVGRQFAGTLIFEPGEISKTIDIPVGEYQAGDTLNIFLSEAENATLVSPSSASLTILDKDRSECHVLTMDNTGYGKLPVTTNLKNSIACPAGEFVADELIFVLAEPDPGWTVDGWFGTLDNNLTTSENIVRMPDSAHLINVYYITSSYLPSLPKNYTTYFEGPQEAEPNNTLSMANGPIRSGKDYFGGFAETSDIFDNYFFSLPAKGSVQLQLVDVPVDRDYNLLLLSSNSEIKGYSGSLGNAEEHISVNNLDPGLYYVSIYFFSGPISSEKYRLNVIYD